MRTITSNKLAVAALALAVAIGGMTLLFSPGEAEAAYAYLGSGERVDNASASLTGGSLQMQDAVAALAEQENISLPSASVRWIDRSGNGSALALTDRGTTCLVEETASGVTAACDTAENVAEHGLYLARFVRPSGGGQIDGVVVLAASPEWATHLSTGAGAAQPIAAGFHSLRFAGEQAQGIDAVTWEAPALGRSESAGLELPAGLTISTEG